MVRSGFRTSTKQSKVLGLVFRVFFLIYSVLVNFASVQLNCANIKPHLFVIITFLYWQLR